MNGERPTRVWDPFDAQQRKDPFPLYAWLREHQPVHYNERRRVFALTRFADVMAAAHDAEVFSSAWGPSITGQESRFPNVIAMDNPRHDQLRKLVSRGFTPRAMAKIAADVERITTELVDGFIERGKVELVEEFSGALPILVIAALLGIDSPDVPMFKGWADALVRQDIEDPESVAAARDAYRGIDLYVRAAIREREARPRDDLITRLVEAEVDGERLSVEEVVGFCFLLMVAGTETTTNLIGNATVALAQQPSVRAELAQNIGLLDNAIEEFLRYVGPVQSLGRQATRDVTLHGVTIPEGSRVALVWAAANRDPAEFDEPDRLTIHRTFKRHVALGHGIHYCLGAALARMETKAAFEAMLTRMPEWQLVDDEVSYAPSPQVRGPRFLNLAF